MIKQGVRLFCASLLIFLTYQESYCQQLLSLEELDTVQVFNSIEEMEKKPESVIRIELKKKKLKTIPAIVYQCKNLQYLDLSKNKLDTFPAELGTLTQLRVLILSKNEINYITETLGNLTNLVVLKASNNFLWEIDKSLGQLAQLEVLDIWANRLIDLPGTMDELYNLRYLDMRVNPVKREMQEEIQDYVPECKMHFSYDCKCY